MQPRSIIKAEGASAQFVVRKTDPDCPPRPPDHMPLYDPPDGCLSLFSFVRLLPLSCNVDPVPRFAASLDSNRGQCYPAMKGARLRQMSPIQMANWKSHWVPASETSSSGQARAAEASTNNYEENPACLSLAGKNITRKVLGPFTYFAEAVRPIEFCSW